MLLEISRCKIFTVITILALLSSSLEAKNDLKIQVPENSVFQISLNQCSGRYNNTGKYRDFYFKYDSAPGAVFYRSGNGWVLVPEKKTSKAIITVELDVKDQHQLTELLARSRITLKDQNLKVRDLLGYLLSDKNFNVEIMDMNPDLINHNSIYYKITKSKPEVPEEPVVEQIYLPEIKDDKAPQDEKNIFFELVRDYLPENFHYSRENVSVDFEAGLVMIKNVQINNETGHFSTAHCNEVQIQLKHDDFVEMVEFEPLDGENTPEFDYIMKNELRSSMFQIRKIKGEFRLLSQKFGFNTLIPGVLPSNNELFVEVFNDKFEISPGRMEKGKIVFRATAKQFKFVPNLEFVIKNSNGNVEPANKALENDLEVYVNGEKLKDWQYGDSLYKYPGIEYTFRLPDNKRYDRVVEGKLGSENFNACRLAATIKIVRLQPGFILMGNYLSDQEDIFPVNISIDVPAQELPISFNQLLKKYGHINNFKGYVNKYILMRNHISFDKNQKIDERNQNFFVSKQTVKTDFNIKLKYDNEPDYQLKIKYSVVPFVNPENIEHFEKRTSANKLVIDQVAWPVNPRYDDYFIVALTAPAGYEFADGNSIKKIRMNQANMNPVVRLKKKMDSYIDHEQYTKYEKPDSIRVLKVLNNNLTD